MSILLKLGVTLIVAAFVWALLASSLTVAYAAIACMTVAGIGLFIIVSHHQDPRF